ncbi:MAG: hypothetical protein VKN33_00405 [Candidatus Sericytochromatia bacterium]|nr:hypothetical protein [Candidatus Sericytochromatia bacterium]
MARSQIPVEDVLKWLQQALGKSLKHVGVTVDFDYSGRERGSLTVWGEGKVLQTSYFSSSEIRALRDGGLVALEKQREALVSQVDRVLNPPPPQPANLTVLFPARRGRAASKSESEGALRETSDNDSPEASSEE